METAIRLDPGALASFDLALIQLDANGVCTFANAAAAELLGSPQATGWSLRDLFPRAGQADTVQAELQKRLHGEASSYVTSFTRPGDGQDVPVSIYAFPVLDATDQVAGSMAIVTDLRVPYARKRVHQAIESCRDGTRLLEAVAKELQAVVPFDEMRVTALGKRRHHLRTLFSTDSAQVQKYPHKWWPMPPFVAAMADDDTPRIYDIPALFRRPEFEAMAATDPNTARYRDSGVVSSLALPVVSGDRTVAFVSLDSKKAAYDCTHLAVCDKLPLAEAVKMALHLEEERAVGTCLNLIREMGATAGGVQQVGQVLVDALAASFGWDHVAVFQHDEDAQAFRILTQASAKRLRLPDTFVAGEEGIVARAFARQQIVNVPNVRSGHGGDAVFQPGVAGIVSELAIPIPGERPRWVLNVESTLEGAFADEEIELLNPLLTEAGHMLDRLSLLEMRSAVLSAVNDAVIETNQAGVIRSMNPAGVRLFGAAEEGALLGRALQDFLVDQTLREALTRVDNFSRREVELLTTKGEPVPALLSGASLPYAQGGRVFIASDLTYQREVERTGTLKEVFRHASLECRVPLALASGWLSEAAGRRPELEPVVDRVLQQIRKADMPLERLLRIADSHPSPSRGLLAVDLKDVIDDVLAQFPDSDRRNVELELPEQPVRVYGASDDLRFCIETSLSFALRTKPQNKPVKLEMHVDEGMAKLAVGGDWAPVLGGEILSPIRQRWRRTAASDLALAEDVIEDIVGRAHGHFHSGLEDALCLSIELPLAKGA